MPRKALMTIFANVSVLFAYGFAYGTVFYISDYELTGDLLGLFLIPFAIFFAVNAWLLRSVKHGRLYLPVLSMTFAAMAVLLSLAIQELLTAPARG